MKKNWQKILSLALVLVMGIALFPSDILTTKAEAAPVVTYATPATQAEMDNVSMWFTANNGANARAAYAKVVEGKAYVWGCNTNGMLGLTKYKDNNGVEQTVTTGTVVPVPTLIDPSYFNNERVNRIVMNFNATALSTETNHVYAWGLFGGTLPTEVDTTTFRAGNHQVQYINTCGRILYIIDENGELWSANNQCSSSTWSSGLGVPYGTARVLTKVPSNYTALWNNKKVIYAAGCHYETSYVLTEDGQLHFFGNSKLTNVSASSYGDGHFYLNNPVTGSEKSIIPQFTGLKFKYMFAEDQTVILVDQYGDVWAWGTNSNERLGSSTALSAAGWTDYTIGDYSKVFDHNVFQKKALRPFISWTRIVVLCEDNTVYAMGNNANNLITTAHNGNVTTMTHILDDVSQNETIVGIFPANDSQMVITKSGGMLFAGANTDGGAGNGTLNNPDPGVVAPVITASLPPAAPLTENKIIYEIEVVEDGTTYFYVPKGTTTVKDGKTVMLYNKTNKTSMYNPNSPGVPLIGDHTLTIDAGVVFKLNVYFRDFGMIDQFVVPIRFDPTYIRAVNGAGVAYPDDVGVVTPDGFNASTGLIQHFEPTDWKGGSLLCGSATNSNGTYPKVSNAGGYVSIAGMTTNINGAGIGGTKKMFSVNFRAKTRTTSAQTGFTFATNIEADIPAIVKPLSQKTAGYDDSITLKESPQQTAYWQIINLAEGEDVENGNFPFKTLYGTDKTTYTTDLSFPKLDTTYVPAESITLDLTYGANNDRVTDQITYQDSIDNVAPSNIKSGWRINWTNKDVVYTVTARSYGKNERNEDVLASFQRVTWSYELYDENGNLYSNVGDPAATDYILITGTTEDTLKFRINPSFVPSRDAHNTVNEPPVYVRFIAQSYEFSGVTGGDFVMLKSYAGPGTVLIATKPGGVLTPVGTGSTITYHYNNDASENKIFNVCYGVDGNGVAEASHPYGDIVWKLMDSSGVEIDMADAAAVAKLQVGAGAGDNTATIDPRFTLKDDYLILHAESLYDADVYDEIYIRIEMYVTGLELKPSDIRMSVTTATLTSTVDLSDFVVITPVDAHTYDLTYTITYTPAGRPGNADKRGWTSGDTVSYGSLGTGSTASVFTAFGWATPTSASGGEDYVEVTVRDTYTTPATDTTVRIYILDIDSPVKMEDITATNNLGTVNDTVRINNHLEKNDIIRFYKGDDAYTRAVADRIAVNAGTNPANNANGYAPLGTQWDKETTLVADNMYPAFTFNVGDQNSSLMISEGGYIYMTLTRTLSGGTTTTYDPVPINYSAEPSLIYGYAALFGKTPGSIANKDITVGIVGGKVKAFATTDSTGYFKFDTYIAPGQYTLTLSKANYLTRTTEVEIVASDQNEGKFMISSSTAPITLFPGDLNNDQVINVTDITYYVANWVGLTKRYNNTSNFSEYDFYEDGVISGTDLSYLLKRKDWTPESYAGWIVPTQK